MGRVPPKFQEKTMRQFRDDVRHVFRQETAFGKFGWCGRPIQFGDDFIASREAALAAAEQNGPLQPCSKCWHKMMQEKE